MSHELMMVRVLNLMAVVASETPILDTGMHHKTVGGFA
jgi:hypothetical protein